MLTATPVRVRVKSLTGLYSHTRTPGLNRRGAEAIAELARVHERRAGVGPKRPEKQRRAHLRARLLAVQHVRAMPEAAHQLGVRFELVELVRFEREQQIARGLVLRVDPEPLEVAGERVEVLEPELLEAVHLIREARQSVADPVRQRRHQKAAVAAARTVAATRRFEHDDVARRVQLLCVERRPQARVTTADDAQVRLDRVAQRRVRVALRQRVEPERSRDRVGVGCPVRWAGRYRRPRIGHLYWSVYTTTHD